MNKEYTKQDLDNFFKKFQNISDQYKLEKVHQLINNPNAKATHRVKFKYKPFKFIIMTSTIIVGLSAILLLSNPDKVNEPKIEESSPIKIERESIETIHQEKEVSENHSKPETIKEPEKVEIPDSEKTRIKEVSPKNLPLKDKAIEILEDPVNEPSIPDIIETDKPVQWTCDTTIDRETMFVRLTPEELQKIGININKGKIHYHNICPNSDYDMMITNYPTEDRTTTYNDYYIYATSDINCDNSSLSSFNFYRNIDTLVPVIVEKQLSEIFWFASSKKFFETLPSRYNYLENAISQLKKLKHQCPENTFVNYWILGDRVFGDVNHIELNKEELLALDIKISKELLSINSKDGNYRIGFYNYNRSYANGSTSSIGFPPNPIPIAITDTLGRRLYANDCFDGEDKVDREYVIDKINLLIPIKINFEKLIPPRKETLIFWYYPTDDFIDKLPEDIKSELKKEMEAIIDGNSDASNCSFFEACKSTLPVTDYTVYPNPARNSATVEFYIPENIKGRISLVNMNGALVKVVVPTTNFLAGQNNFDIDLSGISPGIYLVSILTDKGFKTQRIIVSK